MGLFINKHSLCFVYLRVDWSGLGQGNKDSSQWFWMSFDLSGLGTQFFFLALDLFLFLFFLIDKMGQAQNTQPKTQVHNQKGRGPKVKRQQTDPLTRPSAQTLKARAKSAESRLKNLFLFLFTPF